MPSRTEDRDALAEVDGDSGTELVWAGDTPTKLRRFGILKDAWWRLVVFMLARSSLDFERSVVAPLWQLLMEELNRRAAPALNELMWLAANACDQVVLRASRLGKSMPCGTT
jgi:hypothetical protein